MKLLVICLFITFFSIVSASDLTIEKVGNISLITIKIDTNELFGKDNWIDYRAIFEVFDSDGKVISLTKKDIKFKNTEISNKRILLFIETELRSSAYIGYLKLNNNLRNDKKEEKFNFIVDESKYSSNLYLVKKIQDVEFEVLSWDDVIASSEIYLYQIYQEKVNKLKFISENSEERKVFEIADTGKLYYKLEADQLIQNFTKNYIEYSLNSQIYQSELKIAKHLNSFQKKYSWDEQLEQIKYIVNDKTWKEINRDLKMSNLEKVLRFWDSNNPKESERNQLQEIFYSRVLYADQKFSVHRYKKGWETDRGRIYIKFGEPDEISVDNHPVGKYPTQTWFYYTLNKTFLFYDRSRIEDYKLYNKEEEYGY